MLRNSLLLRRVGRHPLLFLLDAEVLCTGAHLAELQGRGRGEEDPRLQSVLARLKNIERLRAMERGTADELERVLLKLEELSSQLALLKFAAGRMRRWSG